MPQSPNARVFFALAADANDDGLAWIEVLPTAEKVRNGPFYFTLTADDLTAAAEYIQQHADRIMVDRDHEGAKPDGSTKAAGWFTGETKVVKAGAETPQGGTQDRVSLWAQVKWTPAAQQEIRDGEFKFVSAEWHFKDRDKKTGLMTKFKEFVAATLTNRPFFSELAPVTAALWEAETGLNYLRDKVYAALNPGGYENARYWVIDISTGGTQALVQEYNDPTKTWVISFSIDTDGMVTLASVSDWVEAEQEWVAAARAADQNTRKQKPFTPKGADMDLKVIAKSLGLKEDASEEEVNAALTAQAEKAAEADELKAKLAEQDAGEESELAKAQAQIKSLADSIREKDVDSMLSEAVRVGKILPVQKDALKTSATKSEEGFESVKELIDATPEKSLASIGSAGGGKDEDVTDEGQAVTSASKGFQSETADVDDESVKLHLKVLARLEEQGKTDYDEADYAAALIAVSA